jgi:S-sulfo-L-cysteine synthase (3-phospho-L-serine-dependent)
MKHFVLVESNTTGSGQLAVARLLAQGHRVSFLCRDRERYGFLRQASPGLTIIDVDTNDLGAVVRRLRELQGAGIDALLTFSEFYVAIVAEAAAAVGARFLDPAAAHTCRNKFATRTALRAAGLATPDFWLVASDEQARRLSRTVAYPCVVKPLTDSGSKGVRLVSSAAELRAHCRALLGSRANDRGQPVAGEALVESLLSGPEFSVETITLAGAVTKVVGVTTKHLGPPPHFVEIGHEFPSAIDRRRRQQLVDSALAALSAVGFDLGPAHTEIHWTAAGPVVVEINPRLAGGMIPELVRHATGIDLLAAVLDLASGGAVDLEASRRRAAAIGFLTASTGGRVARIDGLTAARAAPSIREVHVATSVGRLVRPAQDAYDRLGWVIASGRGRRRVAADLAAALRLVRIEIEPRDDGGRPEVEAA